MKSVFLSALIALSMSVFAQEAKSVLELDLDKGSLDQSTMVTVNGQQVPLLVLTEIQKICDQRNFSQKVCEDLIAKGCAEYKTVVDTKKRQH